MPVNLTTAWDPGDFDAGQSYGELKIISFSLDVEKKIINIVAEYGNTISNVWNPGTAPREHWQVSGADYDTMIAELPTDANEEIYVGAARVLYQWLIDNGHVVGTII